MPKMMFTPKTIIIAERWENILATSQMYNKNVSLLTLKSSVYYATWKDLIHFSSIVPNNSSIHYYFEKHNCTTSGDIYSRYAADLTNSSGAAVGPEGNSLILWVVSCCNVKNK